MSFLKLPCMWPDLVSTSMPPLPGLNPEGESDSEGSNDNVMMNNTALVQLMEAASAAIRRGAIFAASIMLPELLTASGPLIPCRVTTYLQHHDHDNYGALVRTAALQHVQVASDAIL